MIVEQPFALLITWTCYGTWLPGDPRGHTSNTLLPERGFRHKQNIPGTPKAPGDPYTYEHARSIQKGDTVFLTLETATWAAESLIEATRRREWRIVRGAIMANHVHLVVLDCPDDGPGTRRILKGNSQAAMCDKAGRNTKWWTTGGSDRYLHGEEAIEAAIRYVRDQVGILVEIVNMELVIPGERRGSSPPN